MVTCERPRLVKTFTALTLLFTAILVQGCPPRDARVSGDPAKHVGEGKPCPPEREGSITGEGNCYKHIFKAWVGDAQNFPSCTSGYVCNSPGANCSTAAVPSGHCTMSPNSGACDCKCL
jgi:hypothetical protein